MCTTQNRPLSEFCGKTGTAQVISAERKGLAGKQTQTKNNAWFVGFAPRRNPEIVVSVLVQESGKHGGEAAGPVVRDVIKAYYDKKNKKTEGQYTAESKPPAPQTKPISTKVTTGRHAKAIPATVIVPRVALKPEDGSTAATRPVADREH